ncbi:hypothetical protein FRC03_006491 [Tulasnella sp. 419]|nr:hypothetical protein FRC03_006491 [Tulasnella sp. 419]
MPTEAKFTFGERLGLVLPFIQIPRISSSIHSEGFTDLQRGGNVKSISCATP